VWLQHLRWANRISVALRIEAMLLLSPGEENLKDITVSATASLIVLMMIAFCQSIKELQIQILYTWVQRLGGWCYCR